MNSTFKMLGPNDVWHPKAGARRGNKHALKHGRHTKEARALRARIRTTGLSVEATPFTSENGRIRGEFRIGRR